MQNPFLGIIFHWMGGLASASFYLPYRGVRRWSWETYWLAGGVFSWLIAPWVFAFCLVPHVGAILSEAPPGSVLWAFLFGALWGVGGLCFGLTMRYLGIALGMAVALGYCAAFGTLIPPLAEGRISAIFFTTGGKVVLFGVFCCLVGIALSGAAGMSKERELTTSQKKQTVKEFSFGKGMLMATISGIFSSCFAFGLSAAAPIGALAKESLLKEGGSVLWENLPGLIVILLGGFLTNAVWCIYLARKHGSGKEYFGITGASEKIQIHALGKNWILVASAGILWYLQFFFYGMGQTQMGSYEFSSWTLHMSSIIIFSTLWGIALHEWRGVGRRTKALVFLGLLVLVGSTVIVGFGNYLQSHA